MRFSLPSAKDEWKSWLQRVWRAIPILTLAALWYAFEANQIAKESQRLQRIPRLSVELRPEQVHVGPMPGRVDNVVTVPITVHNSGGGEAYDVVVDLVILYDNREKGTSLNDYFRQINSPIMHKATLAPGEKWNVPSLAPSVANNAEEVYKTGSLECKIKVPLIWHDIDGKEYRWVTLAQLEYKPRVEGYRDFFWWAVRGSFASLREPNETGRHWGLIFEF